MNDSSSQDRREALVQGHFAGHRLDRFLHEHFPNYSRRELARAIKAGHVRINGSKGRPGDILSAGDRLDIPVWSQVLPELSKEREQRREATMDAGELVELYRDEDLLIVSKPAGVPVHGGAGIVDVTLIDLLKEDVLNGFGLVHRLDQDTTGAIALVRGSTERAEMMERFAASDGGVRKVYEAIISGIPDEPEADIDLPLRPPAHRTKARVDEDGKPAITHYRVVERFVRAARLEIELRTGRTHQIRAHLEAIGHPLLVDPLYGARKGSRIHDPRGQLDAKLRRTPVHARVLALPHPKTGKVIEVTAPIPADMRYALEVLRVVAGRGRKRGGLPPALEEPFTEKD